MEEITQLDWSLFQIIHYRLRNDFFDIIMPLMRNRNTWIPLYVLILIYAFYKFTLSKAIVIVLGLIATVALADFASSQVIKKSIKRPRPCHQHGNHTTVESLVNCGSGYSFPSSHASNHFGIAFYLILSGFLTLSWWKRAALLWAFGVSFAQVYVGLHYPVDILGGALLGITVAYFVWSLLCKFYFNRLNAHPVS